MTHRVTWRAVLAAAFIAAAAAPARAVERFPPPDFQSDYQQPTMAEPNALTGAAGWFDVGLLAAALGLQTWLVLRYRSRIVVAWTTVLWLAYFGFYREGCTCPIGATQNVALALAEPAFAIRTTVVAIFGLPVVFALLFGRVFCGGVCPLGGIQDVVLVRPIRVPRWLDAALGVFPYVYLGLAVLLAATGSMFIICRYDPFVAFFRLTGTMGMLTYGGILLGTSLVIGRPYCRYLCPYGALLGLCSKVAWKGASVTPDYCISCRLCDEACPVDSIRSPEDVDEGGPS